MGKTIGIDLGTTNSCVSVVEGGRPVIIPNEKGGRTTPSVVAFTQSGERLVGDTARRQAAVNSARTISSVKRHMGTDWHTVIDGKKYTPQEISAMILRKLRKDAEEYLGEEVTDAVITVPAYFNDIQRQATKDAGRIAGLNVKRIINEPTSAALAYGLDNGAAQKVMVYDLGGGTFDVSIIEIGDGVIEVLATNGDNHLGGDDFDARIVDHLVSELRKGHHVDAWKDVSAMQRIHDAAEQAKKELSSAETTMISLPYKNKKRYQNDPEDMVIFRDVNPAIWDRETFEKIQALTNGTRKRKGMDGEKNMFSGLLKCADCGKTLHFHFNQANHDIKYFNCPGYNQGKRKICQSTHYIRVDFLEQIVLSEVRRLTRFACQHEDVFIKAVANYSKEAMEADQRVREGELRALIARDKELDVLFEKIYEDNALGKISDERFKKLAQKYEDEQSSIAERIGELKAKFDEATSKVANTDTFIAAVRKYTRIRKLTPRVLAELIDHIEVHQAETVPGGQLQRVVIYYNCIGSIEIPDEVAIPLPQVTMKTRQGVAVTYDPLPLATV